MHDVNKNDTIEITSPATLAGTYTVENSTSASFTVELSTTPSITSWDNIVYTINGNVNSQTTSSGVLSVNKLLITKFPNSNVTSAGEITITYPQDIEGTYTPISSNDNEFVIEVDGTIDLSQLTGIKYTYSRDLTQFNVTR